MLPAVRARIVAGFGHILAAAVCALVGHVALVQSIRPTDEAHIYLSWYQPLIAGLSGAAVLALAVLLVLGLLGHRVLIPAASLQRRSFDQVALRIGMSGVAFLLVQETIERSVVAGAPAAPSFAAGRWLVVLVVVAASSALLAFLGRWGERAVRRLLAETPQDAVSTAASWSTVQGSPRRSRPLALHAALRAPPRLSPA